jgi:hypothetical protein
VTQSPQYIDWIANMNEYSSKRVQHIVLLSRVSFMN